MPLKLNKDERDTTIVNLRYKGTHVTGTNLPMTTYSDIARIVKVSIETVRKVCINYATTFISRSRKQKAR